jgi:simple sugar transport system permease protein
MFRLKARKRREPQTWGSLVVLLAAILLSLGVSGLLLALQGKPALHGLAVLFQGAFGSLWSLQDVVLKAVPIFLCSLGVSIAFRMQIWNIGAEGQFALGSVGATFVVLRFPDLPAWAMLPAMGLAAGLAGGAWALIPAVLKLRLRVNEIISTLMLNYIGALWLDYLVYGAWKGRSSLGFPMTEEFPPAAVVPAFLGTRLHWDIVLCVLSALGLSLFLRYTRLGYELKASGEGLRVARYARLPYGRLVLLVMVMSGAFAGLAGFLETSAVVGRLQPSVLAGYGYTAIVVAWIARLRTSWIGLASLLLAGLRVGAENLQLELQVPAAFAGITEGMLLLVVLAGQFFRHYTFARATPAGRPGGQG